jgi:hypothetical protein
MEHSIKFKVGQTRFGQDIELIKEVDGSFTIKKYAAGQRDETVYINYLDAITIRNMIKAVDLKLTEVKH